jgi:hypothetical protein
MVTVQPEPQRIGRVLDPDRVPPAIRPLPEAVNLAATRLDRQEKPTTVAQIQQMLQFWVRGYDGRVSVTRHDQVHDALHRFPDGADRAGSAGFAANPTGGG